MVFSFYLMWLVVSSGYGGYDDYNGYDNYGYGNDEYDGPGAMRGNRGRFGV